MRRRYLIIAASISAIIMTALPMAGIAAPNGATMMFGMDVGSKFQQPPLFLHDNSQRATDTIVPGAVAISMEGTVDFIVDGGFHQVAIYEPGVKPKDIDITKVAPGGPPLINDDEGRVALGGFQADLIDWSPPAPGRYLVICTVAPHFTEGRMWGWVNVR